MPISAEKIYAIYKPTHQLSYKMNQNTQMSISGGGISTSTGIDGYTSISSSPIRTRHNCVSYNITITYDGPVDLNTRIIKDETVPNYWALSSTEQEARRQSGIKTGYTCCNMLTVCIGVLTCTYCCCINCIGRDINERDEKLDHVIDDLASDAMNKRIAEFLRQADELVKQRVEHKQTTQSAPSAVGAGAMPITQQQFQMMMAQFAGAGLALTSQKPIFLPAGSGPEGIPMLPMSRMQQQQGRPAPYAPVSHLEAPPAQEEMGTSAAAAASPRGAKQERKQKAGS